MTDETAPAPQPARRQFEKVESFVPLFDTAKFEHMMRLANVMARSTLMPEHLRGVYEGEGQAKRFVPFEYEVIAANALIVVNLSMKWNADPLAVAQEISIVHGKVVYGGKLVAAIIDNAVGEPLEYEWSGPENSMQRLCVITGLVPGLGVKKSVKGTAADWHTKDRQGQVNKTWTGAAQDKMLAWRGGREWCRLYMPGLMLGLYAADEFDAEAPASSSPPVDLEISAGFGAAKSIEHKPAGVDVAAELARTAPKGEPVFVGVDMAKGPDRHTEATVNQVGHVQAVDEYPAQEQKSSTTPPEGQQTKAAADGLKSAPGPKTRPRKPAGVSANMQKALDRAWKDLRHAEALASGPAAKSIGYTVAFEIDGPPENDDQAQEHIGLLRRMADNLHAAVRDLPPAPPPPPPPPAEKPSEAGPPTVDQILRNLGDVMRPMKTWPDVKAAFSNFSRQHEWKEFDQAAKAQCYRMVWGFANALNVARLTAGEPFEVQPTEDATAFRCALECCDDAGVLTHMWERVTQSESYKGQAQATRDVLAAATMARIELLKGASQ